MALSHYVETLNLLGDESRIRLCALLRERELCVSDLVRVTGMAQSRVSTHLGRLREAGFVWDRRQGTQCFYALGARRAAGHRQSRARRSRGARTIRRCSAIKSACTSWKPSGAAACPSRSRTSSSATTRRGAPGSRSRVGIAGAAQARGRARRRLGRRRGGGVARAATAARSPASTPTRA